MSNQSADVMLAVSDETTMNAYTVIPEGKGPFPAIIVFQEAFGVNAHIRDVANRFAAEGYVAIAPELFHRTAPPKFSGSYTDFTAVAPHFQALTTAGIEADIHSAWNWLQNNPKVKHDAIATTGYCVGGRVSFIANTILPIKAAVSYYGGGLVPDWIKKAPSLHASILFFWGGLDKHILPEHIDAVTTELKKAGKPYTNVVFSDAEHAFFCDARPNYNEQAAKESWALTLAFLKQKLG